MTTVGLDQPLLTPEIIVSLAVEREFSAPLDLMMGVYPGGKRDLTELEERAGHWVTLLAANAALDGADEFSRALALWRDHWPTWTSSNESRRSFDKNIEERWRFLQPHCAPVAAAYLFRPTAPLRPEERQAVEREYCDVFNNVKQLGEQSSLVGGRIVWTASLMPGRRHRRLFEELAGLTSEVKARVGLDDRTPGFLRRYATAHDEAIDELITPRQFEHLVADMYRADGWECHVTPYSKDGGVDIEASRIVDGIPTVILIQVRRNRSKRRSGGKPRPIVLDGVKAFAATVRADGKDRGVLVTSSYVTRDARTWASSKGRRVAALGFVNGTEVRDRLWKICQRLGTGDVGSYILETQGHPACSIGP